MSTRLQLAVSLSSTTYGIAADHPKQDVVSAVHEGVHVCVGIAGGGAY